MNNPPTHEHPTITHTNGVTQCPTCDHFWVPAHLVDLYRGPQYYSKVTFLLDTLPPEPHWLVPEWDLAFERVWSDLHFDRLSDTIDKRTAKSWWMLSRYEYEKEVSNAKKAE